MADRECVECHGADGLHKRACSARTDLSWDRFCALGQMIRAHRFERWPMVIEFLQAAVLARSPVELLARLNDSHKLIAGAVLDRWVLVEPEAAAVCPVRFATLEQADLVAVASYAWRLARAVCSDAEWPPRPAIVQQLLREVA